MRTREDRTRDDCPFCGEELHRDRVDVGVGTIVGPGVCVCCGANEDESASGWSPPIPERLPAGAHERNAVELLLLRRLEGHVRRGGQPGSMAIDWALKRLDEHRAEPEEDGGD